MRCFFAFLIAFFFSQPMVLAQFGPALYGKNRLQSNDFQWEMLTTNRFEVFYYEGGKKYAEYVIKVAEGAFNDVTSLIGYQPNRRIRIFVYKNITHRWQSNIGINAQELLYNGQTRFLTSEIEIYGQNSLLAFKEHIIESLTDALVFEMIYGANLKEIISDTYLYNLPPWFLSGIAAYVAKGWTTELDNFTRTFAQQDKLAEDLFVNKEITTVLGHSIWNYIANKYGKNTVSNILNLTRISKNEEQAFKSILNKNFKELVQEWLTYYKELNKMFPNTSLALLDSMHFQPLGFQSQISDYQKIIPTADPDIFICSKNNAGKQEVFTLSLSTGKTKTLFKNGQKIIGLANANHYPLFTLLDSTNLLIISSNLDGISMSEVNLGGQVLSHVALKDFDLVSAVAVNKASNELFVIAHKNAQTDIYQLNLQGQVKKRLTNTLFDEFELAFDKKNNGLYFTANIQHDSLLEQNKYHFDQLNVANIFYLHLDSAVLDTLTSFNAVSHHLQLKNDQLLFVCTQNGIGQLFQLSRKGSMIRQLTNLDQNIESIYLHDSQLFTGVQVYGGQSYFWQKIP